MAEVLNSNPVRNAGRIVELWDEIQVHDDAVPFATYLAQLGNDVQLRPSLQRLRKGNLFQDLLIFLPFTGKPNVVFFAGARQRRGASHPYLEGIALAKDLYSQGYEFNFLAVSDTSFYLDDQVEIGWYLGSREDEHLQTDIVGLARTFHTNARASKTIMVGGSCGGFAALATAGLLAQGGFGKQITNLVWNPQISIADHVWEGPLQKYLKAAWGDSFPSSAIHDVKCFNQFGDTHILQSLSDPQYYGHIIPFLTGLGLSNGDLRRIHLDGQNNFCNATPNIRLRLLRMPFLHSAIPGRLVRRLLISLITDNSDLLKFDEKEYF